MKCLRINQPVDDKNVSKTKDVQIWYAENYKMQLKEIKEAYTPFVYIYVSICLYRVHELKDSTE